MDPFDWYVVAYKDAEQFMMLPLCGPFMSSAIAMHYSETVVDVWCMGCVGLGLPLEGIQFGIWAQEQGTEVKVLFTPPSDLSSD